MFHLAWRNLSQNRTQLLMGVGGVALALLLMLSLDALLAGSEEDLVAYIIQSGADVFVAQEGVKNMHMAASSITFRDVRRAAGKFVSERTRRRPMIVPVVMET